MRFIITHFPRRKMLFSQIKTMPRLADKIIMSLIILIYIVIRVSLLIYGQEKRNYKLKVWGFSLRKLYTILVPHRLFLMNLPGTSYRVFAKHDSSFDKEVIDELFTPNKNEIVVDFGAHIGRYTIIAAKEGCKVIAIEPNPQTFKILQKNIKYNKLANVDALQMAVSDYIGQSEFYFGAHSGEDGIVPTDRLADFVVNTATLDSLVKKADWVKIDVQGAEIKVLEGAKNLLKNNLNLKLIVEVHGDHLTEPITKILSSYNFRIKKLQRPIDRTNYYIFASRD